MIDVHGNDVTEMYVKGAKAALEQVQSLKATAVVLKEYSPPAAAG